MEKKFGFFEHLLTGLGVYDITQFREAEIKEWHVHEGGEVFKGDLLCTFDTDKASIDLPSVYNGTIKSLLYSEGEKWQAGETEEIFFVPGVPMTLITPELGIIEVEEEVSYTKEREKEVQARVSKEEKPTAHKRKIHVTYVAQRMMEVQGITLEEFQEKYPGKETIERGDVETYLKEKEVEKLDGVRKRAVESFSEKTDKAEKKHEGVVAAVPRARVLAKEKGADLATINGSGEQGIITVADVERIKGVDKEPPMSFPTHPNLENAVRIERPSMLRKAIAEYMTLSQTIPTAGNETEIDVTRLVQKRDAIKTLWEKTYDTRLKYDHFVMYFVAKHILEKEFALLNGYWDKDNFCIMHPRHVNLGIAVQTNDGLIVPVLRKAEEMGFAELVGGVNTIVEKALARTLMIGDTFDLTTTVNRAAFRDEHTGETIGGRRPEVLVPYTTGISGEKRPTTFILAFGKIQEDHERKMLTVVFRFDHRIVDGKLPEIFVNRLKRFLEKDCVENFTEIITN